MNQARVVRLEDMKPGQSLPALELGITTSSIVAGAIATRDFHPIHHDVDRVRLGGHEGLFLNIFSTNAYIERWVTTWLSPFGRIERLDIRLGGPCYAGQTLRIAGTVTEVHPGLPSWLEVEVNLTCGATRHAHGSLRLNWL